MRKLYLLKAGAFILTVTAHTPSGAQIIVGVDPPPDNRPRWTAAQLPPGGSYMKTCREIKIEGSLEQSPILVAICRKSNGEWRQSQLILNLCIPNTSVSNQNGQLSCLPEGSWAKTCQNPKFLFSEGAMRADCKRRDGYTRNARLESVATCRPGSVENLDGNLVCDRK